MDERERWAHTLASVVPQLLGVQVETADPDTADSVALAVERIADRLLHEHDALLAGHPAPPATARHSRAPQPPGPGAGLRAAVRRGTVPGRPESLQLAAGELRALVRRVQVDDPACASAFDPALVGIAQLATALDEHADLLRTEGARLRGASGSGQRDQVLARIVRGERRLTRVAMTTLPS